MALIPLWSRRSPLEWRLAMSHSVLCVDGSGKPNDKRYVSFCGLVASIDEYSVFNDKWEDALKACGLTHLHTAEVMRLPFTRSAPIIERLTDVIRSQSIHSVGFGAPSTSLNDKGIGRAELILFDKAVMAAISQMSEGHTLAIVCDWEEGFDAECLALFHRLKKSGKPETSRLNMIGFGNDEAYAGLQAADMLAYFSCRELARRHETPELPVDPLYVRLLGQYRPMDVHIGELYDAETLKRMVRHDEH